MPDLFQPDDFSDGQVFNAAAADKIHQGLEALDVELDRVGDAVADLQANGGGGGGTGQMQSGPRASFSPAIGLILLDTSLTPPRYIGGYGTEWRNLDGTAITTTPGGGGGSEPGTSTAPANMTATVVAGGTIGQINMSWGAVPGASSYKLYESASPNGVAGAEALTTTSTSRTPGTARNYDYWVTATVGGVESAASNHVFPVLPYVAPGGGGGTPTGTDPSTLLNINGKGNGTGGWWNLGRGVAGGAHVDITPTQLQNGFIENPYYVMNATGTGVQMQTFMNSGTTSGSSYPRTELREFATGSTSTRAAWSGSSGRHIMRGRSRVMHYAPTKCEVVVAQMHDGSDDTLQIRAEASSATGAQTWRLSVNGTEVDDLISGVALGQEVQWEIDCNGGNLTVRINGSVAYGPTNPGYGAGQYFKVGCYAQQSTAQGNSSSEYTRIELRDLFVSHS